MSTSQKIFPFLRISISNSSGALFLPLLLLPRRRPVALQWCLPLLVGASLLLMTLWHQDVAPLGLVATIAEEYVSNNNLSWEGGESGVEFTSAVACISNNNVAVDPSCNHVGLEALLPAFLPHDPPLKLPI
jgi:hypothetical protein